MTDSFSLPMTMQDWLPWLGLVLLGIAGGLINTYRRWKKSRVFFFFELIGELTTSGFVAVLVAAGCRALEISYLWTFVLAGIGAHLGPRALFVMEWVGLRRMGLQEETVDTLVDPPTGLPRSRKIIFESDSKPQSGSGPGPGPGSGASR